MYNWLFVLSVHSSSLLRSKSKPSCNFFLTVLHKDTILWSRPAIKHHSKERETRRLLLMVRLDWLLYLIEMVERQTWGLSIPKCHRSDGWWTSSTTTDFVSERPQQAHDWSLGRRWLKIVLWTDSFWMESCQMSAFSHETIITECTRGRSSILHIAFCTHLVHDSTSTTRHIKKEQFPAWLTGFHLIETRRNRLSFLNFHSLSVYEIG